MPAPRIRPCLRWIPLFVRCIRAHVPATKTKQSYQRANATFKSDIDWRARSRLRARCCSSQRHKNQCKKILADKAYSCEQIRLFLAEHGAVACIPDKTNFKIKHDFDSELYKHRNIVERFFQRIKNFRHIATRFDKLALCFENFVLLAACVIHF